MDPGQLEKGIRMMGNTPGAVTLHSHAARLLAVEVLLADPESLHDDVLESSLYILRDRLQGNDDAPAPGQAEDEAPA
jgi:hypothetical protein